MLGSPLHIYTWVYILQGYDNKHTKRYIGGGGGGQRFAHKNSKLQFLENKYAVWFYKSYQNEKRFLKL